MAYNPDKKYDTGVESNYLCITEYRVDKLSDRILVKLSYFAGNNRLYKNPIENITQAIRMLQLNGKTDIIKEIYAELNKIEPFKTYYGKHEEV